MTIRLDFPLLLPLVAGLALVIACRGDARRPESPRLREAFELLAPTCAETANRDSERDEVLLKTWLAVRGRYPYETNVLRSIGESTMDESGVRFGDFTIAEMRLIQACRGRADQIAGMPP